MHSQTTSSTAAKNLIAVLVSCMLLPEDHAGNFAADLAQMVRSPREESFLTKLHILVLLWWSIIDPNMWKLICQISDCFCGSRLQTIWFETPTVKVVTAKAIYFVALFRRSRERHLKSLKGYLWHFKNNFTFSLGDHCSPEEVIEALADSPVILWTSRLSCKSFCTDITKARFEKNQHATALALKPTFLNLDSFTVDIKSENSDGTWRQTCLWSCSMLHFAAGALCGVLQWPAMHGYWICREFLFWTFALAALDSETEIY